MVTENQDLSAVEYQPSPPTQKRELSSQGTGFTARYEQGNRDMILHKGVN